MAANRQPTEANHALLGFVACAITALATLPASGQRVSIPRSVVDPFSTSPAAPVFDPYAPPAATFSNTVAQPLFNAPAAPAFATPQFTTPQLAAPQSTPLFGQPVSPAPPLFSGARLPIEWQPGTYEWQGTGGFGEWSGSTTETFTRFLAELSLDHAYLFGEADDSDDLEVNELEIRSTFTYPLGRNPQAPLLITPGFAFNFFDGPLSNPADAPRGPDIPGTVYDAYLDASWLPQPLPSFAIDLGLRVGVYSDFDFVNSDSIRVLGRGLGIIKIGPTLDIVAGVVFLDRIDISLLPAGGFRYQPNELWEFYAVFPSPRATRRLEPVNGLNINWFFSGEYGGGSWTANRAGLNDRFDYNDLRITTGIEWEKASGQRGSLEIGYVFDRELVFASRDPVASNLDDTFLIRLGVDL